MATGTEIARLFASIGADTSGLEKGLSDAESALNRTAASIGKIGSTLTMGVTLPLVGIGTAAVKTAVDFDKAMFAVNSVLKLTGQTAEDVRGMVEAYAQAQGRSGEWVNQTLSSNADAFNTLKDVVLDFSTTTSQTSEQVAYALQGIVATGYDAKDAMIILRVAVDAAGNAMTDTETTTRALTATLQAYGMQADQVRHVSDVLFTAVNNSALAFDELTANIGDALGTAAAANVPFETIAAALMTMSKAGYSAAEAATSLRSLIMQILKPSEEFQAVLEGWGYASGEAALQALGLEGVMRKLYEQTGGSAAKLTVLINEIRGAKAAFALGRSGGEEFAAALDLISKASEGVGEHEAMRAVRHQSVAYQMTKLRSEMEVFSIQLGGVLLPAITDIIQQLTKWFTVLATLPPATTELIVKVGLLAAAMGPALVVISKLIVATQTVGSALSGLVPAIELVIIKLGIMTGAATVAQAALMVLVPVAVIAGLALLANHVHNVNTKFEDTRQAALQTATTYEEYKEAVFRAAIETGKISMAYIHSKEAAEAMAERLAGTREEWEKHRATVEAAADGMKRGLAVTTEGLVDYTYQVEDAGNATEGFASVIETSAGKAVSTGQELWSLLAENVTASTYKMVASTEEGAVTMGEALADMGVAWYDLSDEVAFWGQAYQTNIGDIIARQQEMAAATDQAFATMNDIVSRYGQAMADAQAGWMNQVEQNALQHQIGIVEAEINYQRSRAEAIAKAQADISALTAAGLVERAGEVQKKLDEELAMLDYNYETQKAWAEWHWQIQQLMQEHAHQQRLAEQAQYFAKELDLWFAQSKAKILALETETQAVAQWQKTSLNLASLTAKGVVAGAQLQVDALANLGASYDALRKGAEADLSAAQAEMDRLMGEIEALIAAGPQLPDVPDYSQWARDYSGSVASAGSAVKESATATLADVTTDIADAFVTAMEVFEQVAKYKPPAGLAAAMEALRMDIEAAVKQLYIAYEAIGKEGVEGAGLIADSAVKVLQAIGQAADAFTKIQDYTSPMRSALDSVLDDVKYVLIKVREELLDLWGWAGERKDTVWGHMMSWADAVKGVVEVVGEAATAFAEVNKYQGIMPGIVDVLVADIKEVVSKLTSAIGGGDGVSEAQVQWMKLGAELIGLVVGVIDDLEKLAGLEAPARASGNQIALLINALNDTTSTILRWIPDVSGYWTDAQRATDELKVAWLEFEAKLLSTVVGVIDDLEKLAGLEAPVRVSGDIIQSVMGALRTTAQLIRENIGEVSAGFDLAGQPLDALKAAWLEFEAGLVSTLAGVVDDIQKLAGLEGPISVSGEIIQSVMGALRTTAQLIRENIGEVSAGFDLAGQPLDALKAAWLEFEAGLVSTLAGVVDDVEKIAAFEGELQISEDAISNLVNQLEDVANAILTHLDISGKFDEAGNFVDELKIKWAEIATGLVSMFAGAAADLASLADYAPDQAALASGITLFFTNLQQFLVEFDRQAGLFSAAVSEQGAATAKLIGDTVGGLGQAIQPLLDVAQFAVSPDQATTSVTLFFGSLETFLTIFAERAANFQSKASDETAKLAQAIGDTVGGIGNAVEPLINILEYNPEVKDIEKKFEEFFYHLERALFWIEWQKDKWVVSDAAIVLLERVDEVMGYLKTAVDFLDEMATYGQDATTPALVGFLAFLIDLEQIVGVINAARDRIQQEALDSAEEFASGCSTMLGHITDGINTLNSLPTMELDFYQGGYGVGVGFIQGMIDGLVNNASTLYATVAAIVAAAIAAAKAAAGVASPSRQMWNLGENMVDGLVGALRAGQSDVARVMAGLIASPTGVPSFAPAGAGARRWEGRGGAAGGGTTITEVHYHLHEGEVSPERMASLRQQFESMQMLERLRR